MTNSCVALDFQLCLSPLLWLNTLDAQILSVSALLLSTPIVDGVAAEACWGVSCPTIH